MSADELIGFKQLATLKFDKNKLKSFPLLGNATKSISLLDLSGNLISQLTPDTLSDFKQLNVINLRNNPLELQNTCYNNTWQNIYNSGLVLDGIMCDCTTIHLFKSHSSIFNNLLCIKPNNLAGQNAASNVHNFVCEGM
jgi:Leucine-rich repeat (LRR) protein